MYQKRSIEEAIRTASAQFPVVLLTGPRQVGKTTVLRRICGPERRYVTLDDPALRVLANEDPALFFQRFPAPILIDEIQYAPALLPYIKMAVDESRRPGEFWLTGSQQFQLMKGVSETLAGRVAILNLLGFSAREAAGAGMDAGPFLPIGDALQRRAPAAPAVTQQTAFQRIWLGSYPALVTGEVQDRTLFFSSYLQTYLQRDVRDLAQVGDQASFLRFVRACAARTAQLLNMSSLARDADVSVPTAKSWLSILETSFQVVLVRPWHDNVTKRLVKAPKLYFVDTGLCAYLTEWSSPETLAAGAMRGAIFETYVFVELLKSWWHAARSPSLYYYRNRDGREIDFLIQGDGRLYPLEVKLGATPRREWVRGLSAAEELGIPAGEGGVICLCPELLPLSPEYRAIPVGYL